MAKKCDLCGINTIFYVWSSSRKFPINRYLKRKDIKTKKQIYETKHGGFPVCFKCLEELKTK
jgi:hypothetical protein